MTSGSERRAFLPPIERQVKEYHGDVDIFVPRQIEQEYLDAHGIDFRPLANGATLIGATRSATDRAHTNIEIMFPSGSIHEPIGGINHLLEHLAANKSVHVARQFEADANAFTSYNEMKFVMSGVANPRVKGYGIWPVIPAVLDQIMQPSNVTEQALETEKSVVIGEIQEDEGDVKGKDMKYLSQIVFGPSHPYNYRVLGTNTSVASITLSDIHKRHQDFFIPKGVKVGVFTEGDPETTTIIMDQLEQSFTHMQGADKKPDTVDENLEAVLNPEFKPGHYYAQNTSFQTGLVGIHYVWDMPAEEEYSAANFAQTEFFSVASQRFNKFFRSAGLGYVSYPFAYNLGTQKTLLGFYMSVPQMQDEQGFAQVMLPVIKESVFQTFGNEEISAINRLSHARIEATPTDISSRLAATTHGLERYGRVIDTDKLPEINKMITPNHLTQVRDQFMSSEPATIVIGDLS